MMRRYLRLTVLLLAFAPSLAGALTVILVRHAEVNAGASDPALSAPGIARAKSLASMLRDSELKAIYVTSFARTQQTAQPAAGLFHLTPEKVAGTDMSSLVETLRHRTEGTVLVVGHSNTVPAIISGLGGPEVRIGETEFDNFFVLTVDSAGASLVRLHYGSSSGSHPASDMYRGGMLGKRSVIMKVDFVKSGGFAGALTNVKGTINFTSNGAEVSSGIGYERHLTPEESAQIRDAANPAALTSAATQIQSHSFGAADMDHYLITVTTDDGKTHEISLNTSGSPAEMQGVNPEVANLVRWIRQESKNILAKKMGAK